VDPSDGGRSARFTSVNSNGLAPFTQSAYLSGTCQGSVVLSSTINDCQCIQVPFANAPYNFYAMVGNASGCPGGIKPFVPPSNNDCFHESTKITYKNVEYTLEQLKSHPECVVPHVRKETSGLKISTAGGKVLRVTDEHLVFSIRGLVPARALRRGDSVYTDILHPRSILVLDVEVEHGQTYFGLNCEESVVLANGIKTSTFGNLHTVPSTWMKYASKLFGIRTASRVGDVFSSIAHKVGLI
jgi:hypothetical protein